MRSILPERELIMLYNCLILPYLQYCNIIWASVGTTKLEIFHKLQKKVLRICTNSPYRAHSRPIFSRLNTLNIYDIHKFQIAALMFRTIHNTVPINISNMFILNNSVHAHNTRSNDKFHYPKVQSQSLLNSVRHSGPRIWNDISKDLRTCSTITSFKAKLKTIFINSYSD